MNEEYIVTIIASAYAESEMAAVREAFRSIVKHGADACTVITVQKGYRPTTGEQE